MKDLEKTSSSFADLDELHKLKINKVFMYKKLDKKRINESVIVFEGKKMKYIIFDKKIIDLF